MVSGNIVSISYHFRPPQTMQLKGFENCLKKADVSSDKPDDDNSARKTIEERIVSTDTEKEITSVMI